MEIPELNIISDFEVLQNPSLFARVFSLSGIGEVLRLYSFWKWGALILAFVATFAALITRVKLLIIRFVKSLDSSVPPIKQFIGDSDSDDDDEDDSSSTDSSDDEEYSRSTSFHDREPVDEDFSVAGSCWKINNLRLRCRRSLGGDRFSWSDFASGRSVVKLWDSLGLEFDSDEDSSESVVSIWDLNKDQRISSFTGGGRQIPAVSTSSPAVIFSAGSSNSNNVMLAAYDTRVGGQIPAMYAEWLPRRGKVVDVDLGGIEKAYVRDDVTGKLTVGDLRKISSPLEDPTDSDGDTWWDADAVIGSDEIVDH